VPLSSTSTLAEIKAAYVDNADYDDASGAANVAKAKLYRHACRILLMRLPKVTGQGTEIMHLTPDLLVKEIEKASEWLAGHDTASGGSIDGVAVPVNGPTVTTMIMGGRE
jgi:hypothetical protein